MPIPQPPGWLKALGEFLAELLAPIGRLLGMSWPVFQWVLIALAVAGVVLLAWRLIEPLLNRPPKSPEAEAGWAPDRAEATALLDDADRLAAEGRFDEAAHLLLRRSVAQIAAAKPDWVHPASTAREIAAIHALPQRARNAFAVITARVERSRYALRLLDAADWSVAREAYADFALQSLAVSEVRA